MSAALTRLVSRAYRALLGLAPGPVRRLHMGEMEAAFDATLRDVRRNGGRGAFARATIALFSDLVWTMAMERVRSTKDSRSGRNAHGPRFRGRFERGRPPLFGSAVRQLRRHPGFCLLAILTLGLGVGANTAVFQVAYATLIRPLPYDDADRLVRVSQVIPGQEFALVGPATFLDWRERIESLSDMAMYDPYNAAVLVDDQPLRIQAARVSRGFFSLFGAGRVGGRDILSSDEVPGAEPVVVLNHGLATRLFGGVEEAMERSLSVDGVSRRVVGVTRETFEFPLDIPHELWIPFPFDDSARQLRGTFYAVVGRLAADRTVEQAGAEVDGVTRALSLEYPDQMGGYGARADALPEQMLGPIRPSLLLLMGSAGLVLLICCANVGHLILSRNSGRGSELALRRALGASRPGLFSQLIGETALLAILSGGVGIVISLVVTDLLLGLAPSDVPRLSQVGMTIPVLLFAVGVSLLTGAIAGVAPAWRHARARPTMNLGTGRTTRRAPFPVRAQDLLLASEAALIVVSVIASALLLRSFREIGRTDPGFEYENRLVLAVELPDDLYPDFGSVQRFFDGWTEAIRAVPGVESVGYSTHAPTRGGFQLYYQPEGKPVPSDPANRDLAQFEGVTPEYMRALGVRLLEGRPLEETDGVDDPNVLVLNRTMAEMNWPGESAVGKIVTLGGGDFRVVGVIEDVRQRGLDQPVRPQMYMAEAQMGFRWLSRDVVVETRVSDPMTLAPAMRATLSALAPELPFTVLAPMDQVVSESIATPRFRTFLISVLAGLAFVLGLIGIFGVVSYRVRGHQREIGIRMSMGASTGAIARSVLNRNLAPVLVGATAGVVLALIFSGTMEGLLFGVSATDPVTYGLVGIAVLGCAAGAALIPSLRASRMEPAEVLRPD